MGRFTGQHPSERAFIRATGTSSFRAGEWARVTGVTLKWIGHEPGGHDSWRPCYAVEFADGTKDEWAVYDAASYEFRAEGEIKVRFEATERATPPRNFVRVGLGGAIDRNRALSWP